MSFLTKTFLEQRLFRITSDPAGVPVFTPVLGRGAVPRDPVDNQVRDWLQANPGATLVQAQASTSKLVIDGHLLLTVTLVAMYRKDAHEQSQERSPATDYDGPVPDPRQS